MTGEPVDATAAYAQQRVHLRRILVAFVVVVLLLPIAGIGDAFGWLVLPLVAVAAYALRESMRLRRSVRAWGTAQQAPPPSPEDDDAG